MELTLDRRRIRLALSWMYGTIVLISAAFIAVKLQTGAPVPALGWLFHVNSEQNIPTWTSSMGLFLCAQLLLAIGALKKREEDPFAFQWLLMAALFFLISMDEVSGIHEHVNKRLKNIFKLSGLLYYAWVIPAGAFVAAFAAYYFRFLMALSSAHRRRFVASGAVYVGGALVAEAISGKFAQSVGDETAIYELFAHLEEFMEMAGIVCFVDALIAYWGEYTRRAGARLLVADDRRPA